MSTQRLHFQTMTTYCKDTQLEGPMLWDKMIPEGSSSKCFYCSLQKQLKKFLQDIGYKQKLRMMQHKILDCRIGKRWLCRSRLQKNYPAGMALNR